MDEQQQYTDFLNDIKEALLDENADQTPDDVNRLLEENQSKTKAKLEAQRARDREMLVITEQRRRELEHDKQQLKQECEQLIKDREEFEQKRKLLDQEQQQYFSNFLQEQLDAPTRVGDKIIIERDTQEMDLERDHLIEQFKQLENERKRLERDREILSEQRQKHKLASRKLINEQSDFVKHGVMDRHTLDTHMKQLVHVCEQLRAYDPRLEILPRKVFKTIPGVFREQIIKAYDNVLTALENVEQMSITSAYKLIERVNSQAVARPDTQQTVEQPEVHDALSDQFDYDAYKKRLKKHHEQIAEKHIAELMERPEESLLENYEPTSMNETFFEGLREAKEQELEGSGDADGDSDSNNFVFDTSEYLPEPTIPEQEYDTVDEQDTITPSVTSTESQSVTSTESQSVTSTESQPITSTESQPVTSTESQPVTSVNEDARISTVDYIRGLFYKHPVKKGLTPDTRSKAKTSRSTVESTDPLLDPVTFVEGLASTPSEAYNKGYKALERDRSLDPEDPYDMYNPAIYGDPYNQTTVESTEPPASEPSTENLQGVPSDGYNQKSGE